MTVHGGVESYDALSLQVNFRERAVYIVALLRKMTCNLRHSMPLRHPAKLTVEKVLCNIITELTFGEYLQSHLEWLS